MLFDAVLDLSEAGGESALPDTGDLEADLKLVLRATVDEFNDPRHDRLLRALALEIAADPALAKLYANGSTARCTSARRRGCAAPAWTSTSTSPWS